MYYGTLQILSQELTNVPHTPGTARARAERGTENPPQQVAVDTIRLASRTRPGTGL